MAINIGRIKKVGIGIEAVAWGTKAASLTWIPVLSLEEGFQQEKITDTRAIGRIEDGLSSSIARKWSEPKISFLCDITNIGILLKAVFGTSAPTGPSDTVAYSHALSVKNDNVPVSVSIAYKDANRNKVITGAVVNTFDMQIVQNDFIKVDISFIGKYPVDSTDTPSYTADILYTGSMVTTKLASTIAGLSGASAVCLTEANLSINKNASADEFFCIGSTEPSTVVNKQFGVSGSLTRNMDNETYADLFDAGTNQAIEIKLLGTTLLTGAATTYPSLTFTIAPSSISNFAIGSGLDDVTTESFDFTGLYSQGDSKMISATLVNITASY